MVTLGTALGVGKMENEGTVTRSMAGCFPPYESLVMGDQIEQSSFLRVGTLYERSYPAISFLVLLFDHSRQMGDLTAHCQGDVSILVVKAFVQNFFRSFVELIDCLLMGIVGGSREKLRISNMIGMQMRAEHSDDAFETYAEFIPKCPEDLSDFPVMSDKACVDQQNPVDVSQVQYIKGTANRGDSVLLAYDLPQITIFFHIEQAVDLESINTRLTAFLLRFLMELRRLCDRNTLRMSNLVPQPLDQAR
jgi:hypothetical protein